MAAPSYACGMEEWLSQTTVKNDLFVALPQNLPYQTVPAAACPAVTRPLGPSREGVSIPMDLDSRGLKRPPDTAALWLLCGRTGHWWLPRLWVRTFSSPPKHTVLSGFHLFSVFQIRFFLRPHHRGEWRGSDHHSEEIPRFLHQTSKQHACRLQRVPRWLQNHRRAANSSNFCLNEYISVMRQPHTNLNAVLLLHYEDTCFNNWNFHKMNWLLIIF